LLNITSYSVNSVIQLKTKTHVVSSECSCMAHIPAPSFRPHQWCVCQSSLVTSAGKDRFHGRRAELSGAACCWSAVSSTVHMLCRHPVFYH